MAVKILWGAKICACPCDQIITQKVVEMQQQSQLVVKSDPSEVPAGLPRQQSPPQLQAYHLATVAPRNEQVQVSLGNASTWRKFSRQNTEMIVTKAGRRMFPSLSLEVRGLDPARKYEIYVTLLLADQHTLKYQRGVWIPNGPSETYPPPGCSAGLVYVHPDSPSTGRHWTKQEVTFMKLKLTNKLDGFDDPGRNGSMIFAYSMHKYLPVVHISEVPQNQGLKHEAAQDGGRFYTSVVFPGTEFITVTAYQNPELTDLKIQFNPYAKGIRNQTDRSSTLLIDTFRPIVQSRQQQQQLVDHQQEATQQQQHQQQQLLQPSGFEFGAYPNQAASSYGHWQQPAAGHSRRHQPYILAPSSAASQEPSLAAASSSSTSSTFYPAAAAHQYFYQPYQQHHMHYHHASYYAPAPQLEEQYQQPQVALTPPPLLMPHPIGGGGCEEAPATYATPQGCSTLGASSSAHVTDSSPSGVSFHSPDL